MAEGVCCKSLPAADIWQCVVWLCLRSEPIHCASICCPISYSRLARVNSQCVHQWACVLAITRRSVSHFSNHSEFHLPHSEFLSYPHPPLVSCPPFLASSTPYLVNAVSVTGARRYFQHSLQEPIKSCATGNSFADLAVREQGVREGFYTPCMLTVQLCQESQTLSSCEFKLMRSGKVYAHTGFHALRYFSSMSLQQSSHEMTSPALRFTHSLLLHVI